MNYNKSKDILDKIRDSESILVNCHRDADPDSVGSASALHQALLQLDVNSKIISPNKPQERTEFIPLSEKIEIVDFKDYDFDKHDLFIIIDSGSPQIVTGSEDILLPKIEKIVIDHHDINTINGESIRLIDPDSRSATQLLYGLFKDWGIKMDRSISKCLLAGIIGDTGAFQYPKVGVDTFQIAAELMSNGVDKDEIVMHIYRSEPFELLKFWGEVLKSLKIDNDNGFIWSAIPYEKYVEHGKPEMGRRTSVERFGTLVDGTKFGIIMVEQEKENLVASFRSRTGFDTTRITKKLGGGGHVYASGCQIKGKEFRDAVDVILSTTRDAVSGSNQ